MSNSSETGLDLEELELQLLPAWAKQSPDTNRYAKYEGGDVASGPRGRDRRGQPPGRSDRGQRDERGRARPRASRDERSGPPRRAGGGQSDRERGDERREPAQPLPEVSVNFVPEEKGVESLARQIKLTGRAYPIFDIAHLILKRPDRYHVVFSEVKKADGQVAQRLWVCNLDETLWLSEQEAVNHVLRKHFDTFYKAERIPADPPKGTYTFVAQCTLSGAILGPPNYHDYQNKLRKLHTDRFSRMPFEVYKSKVKIVKDEVVVKKWIEDQSWKTEFVCLNVPEAQKLSSRDEVEKHFREVHFANIIRPVAAHTLLGSIAQQLPAPGLRQLLRLAWDEQQRFPLRIVTTLSQQFAAHGLQFFKVNKTITHVAVARPHYLDMDATPVSEGVKRIVDYINERPGCTRRRLIEALAPSPETTVARTTPEPQPGAVGPEPTGEQVPAAPVPPSVAAPLPLSDLQEPTAEQTAVIADLHWLIHQGHVLEFANGRIETAKKPIPKPPRPERKPAVATVSAPNSGAQVTASPTETTATEPSSSSEVLSGSAPAQSEPAPQSTTPDATLSPIPAESPAETAGVSTESASQPAPEAPSQQSS